MRAASLGLLFETKPVNLKSKCVDGTKTLTTRVWCRANFEALSTAAKSALIPARTNYSTEDIFGHLLILEIKKRCINTLTPWELTLEATGHKNWEDFANQHCKGVPVDKEEFFDQKDMVVFSVRFKFLSLGTELPEDLTKLWRVVAPAQESRVCGVCSHPGGLEVCHSCNLQVHNFSCSVSVQVPDVTAKLPEQVLTLRRGS